MLITKPNEAYTRFVTMHDDTEYAVFIFMPSVLKQWDPKYMLLDKLNNRNKKKDDLHLNKHAMHLVRLYLMCLDLLEKGDIITYREQDREFLLSIRNGKFQNEDHTYRSEFFDMISNFEKRLQYAKENTSLPDEPNTKAVEEFVMRVNEGVIKSEDRSSAGSG